MRRIGASVAVAALAALSTAYAGDWPTWRGPERTGVSGETGLLRRWPDGGPEKLWTVTGLGAGFATVAVADGRIYTTGLLDGEGRLFAILPDGRILGKASYGREVDRGSYRGSRSTPTVAAGRVYVMSGFGVVTCFDAQRGKIQWQVDTFERFGGRQINWQISESLLVDRGRVICTPGGSRALLVALDAENGRPVWRTRGLDCRSAYCSPTVVRHDSRRMILTMVEEGAVGVDADNGRLLWHHAHRNQHAVHAATPIYEDGRVFISSGYGLGSELLQLSSRGDRVRRLWRSRDLCNHHGGVILVDGALYGTSDRELVCLDFRSGERRWAERRVGKESITCADGMLIVYSERGGTVSLVEANPRRCEIAGQFRVTDGDGQHWAHPVVANGRLYIRHGDALMAYDISR